MVSVTVASAMAVVVSTVSVGEGHVGHHEAALVVDEAEAAAPSGS